MTPIIWHWVMVMAVDSVALVQPPTQDPAAAAVLLQTRVILGVGILSAFVMIVSAAVSAFLTHRSNRSLNNKRLDVDIYKRLYDSLGGLSMTLAGVVSSLQGLLRLLKTITVVEGQIVLLEKEGKLPNTGLNVGSAQAVREFGLESWTSYRDKVAKAQQDLEDANRDFLQLYRMYEVLLMDFDGGVRAMSERLGGLLSEMTKLAVSAFGPDPKPQYPTPELRDAVREAIEKAIGDFSAVTPWPADITREFQNRLIARRRHVTYRRCAKSDELILTRTGPKSALELKVVSKPKV